MKRDESPGGRDGLTHLCLSRKSGQSIVIVDPNGNAIQVVVYCVGHNRVRFGIRCDRRIKILREELVEGSTS